MSSKNLSSNRSESSPFENIDSTDENENKYQDYIQKLIKNFLQKINKDNVLNKTFYDDFPAIAHAQLFSQEIINVFKTNISGPVVNVKTNYQILVLNKIIDRIFKNKQEFDDDQYSDIIQIIRNHDQNEIRQKLQQWDLQNDEIILNDLYRFGQINESFELQKSIIQDSEKLQKSLILNHKLEVSSECVMNIIAAKYQYGPFSSQVSLCIQKLSKYKKSDQKKIQKQYKQIFRQIVIPQNTLEKLKKLAIEDNAIQKVIKSSISKGNKQQIQNSINDGNNQNNISLKQEVIQQLNALIPPQVIRQNQASIKQNSNTQKSSKTLSSKRLLSDRSIIFKKPSLIQQRQFGQKSKKQSNNRPKLNKTSKEESSSKPNPNPFVEDNYSSDSRISIDSVERHNFKRRHFTKYPLTYSQVFDKKLSKMTKYILNKTQINQNPDNSIIDKLYQDQRKLGYNKQGQRINRIIPKQLVKSQSQNESKDKKQQKKRQMISVEPYDFSQGQKIVKDTILDNKVSQPDILFQQIKYPSIIDCKRIYYEENKQNIKQYVRYILIISNKSSNILFDGEKAQTNTNISKTEDLTPLYYVNKIQSFEYVNQFTKYLKAEVYTIRFYFDINNKRPDQAIMIQCSDNPSIYNSKSIHNNSLMNKRQPIASQTKTLKLIQLSEQQNIWYKIKLPSTLLTQRTSTLAQTLYFLTVLKHLSQSGVKDQQIYKILNDIFKLQHMTHAMFMNGLAQLYKNLNQFKLEFQKITLSQNISNILLFWLLNFNNSSGQNAFVKLLDQTIFKSSSRISDDKNDFLKAFTKITNYFGFKYQDFHKWFQISGFKETNQKSLFCFIIKSIMINAKSGSTIDRLGLNYNLANYIYYSETSQQRLQMINLVSSQYPHILMQPQFQQLINNILKLSNKIIGNQKKITISQYIIIQFIIIYNLSKVTKITLDEKRQYIINNLTEIQILLKQCNGKDLEIQKNSLKLFRIHQNTLNSLMWSINISRSQAFLFEDTPLFSMFLYKILQIDHQYDIDLQPYLIGECMAKGDLNRMIQESLINMKLRNQNIVNLCRFKKGQKLLDNFIKINQQTMQINIKNKNKFFQFQKQKLNTKFFSIEFNFSELMTQWFSSKNKLDLQYFKKVFLSIQQIIFKAQLQIKTSRRRIDMINFLTIVTYLSYEHTEILGFIKFILKSTVKYAKLLYPQIAEVPFQIQRSQQVQKEIKKIYLQCFSDYLKYAQTSAQKITRLIYNLSYRIQYNANFKDDKLYLINCLQKNSKKYTGAQLQKLIFIALSTDLRKIQQVIHSDNFNEQLKNAIQRIMQKRITYQQILNIKSQTNSLKQLALGSYESSIIQFYQRVNNLREQCQEKIKKIKILMRIFNQYQNRKYNVFLRDTELLSQTDRNFNKTQFNKICLNLKQLDKYLQIAAQLKCLMNLPTWWSNQKIKAQQDLLRIRDQLKRHYIGLINRFECDKMNFKQFSLYFTMDLIGFILSLTDDKQLRNKITEYMTHINFNVIKHVKQSMIAINSITQKYYTCQYFSKTLIVNVEALYVYNQLVQKPLQQQNLLKQSVMSISQAFGIIKSAISKFQDLDFNIIDLQDQLLKTLKRRIKYQRVFKLVTQSKLDPNTVYSELIEYTKDSDRNIHLNIEDIKQLQILTKFISLLQESKQSDCNEFFSKARQFVNNEKLSQIIYNIEEKYKDFKQIIESNINKQITLTGKINRIYDEQNTKYLSITSNEPIQIFFIVQKKYIQNEQSNMRVKQRARIFSELKDNKQIIKIQNPIQQFMKFTQLSQIKQKTNLLVSDKQPVFIQFKQLYKQLEQIQNIRRQAITFGYNFISFNQITQTHKSNSIKNHVKLIKQIISQQANLWITSMKKCYNESFLLTHFIGQKLQIFINETYLETYNPLIQSIIGMNKKEFEERINLLKGNKNPKKDSQVQKLKWVFQLFNFKNKEQQTYSKSNQSTNQLVQISLINCNHPQNFYIALVKYQMDQKIPNLNQVFYCHEQTKFQEMQIFLKRAILHYWRKYYFIGVHYLPAEVQLKFIKQLNQISSSKQLKKAFSRCKFYFVDDSANQKIYLHLKSKKQYFKTTLQTNSDKGNHQQKNKVLKNCQHAHLIESRIAGLGKSYKAENIKPASIKIYFSIAGNIDYTRLLERLKAHNFNKGQEYTLILQIGHVQEKLKLQIFLFQIIFFKGFNFKQFFYLPNNITIAIQMQNIYEQKTKEVKQNYPILKIIKDNYQNNYIYIDQFKLQDIKFNDNDPNQIFTFYYLDHMDQKKQDNLNNKQMTLQVCIKQNHKNNIERNYQLIYKYFLNPLKKNNQQAEPTFSLYKSFMKLLFTSFITFSKSGFFMIAGVMQNHKVNPKFGFNTVRLKFLQYCVQNCLDFLKATVNTNDFMNQTQTNDDFRAKLIDFPLLIMNSRDLQNYQLVYFSPEKVNVQIKSLFVSQSMYRFQHMLKYEKRQQMFTKNLIDLTVETLFSENSLKTLKDKQLQEQIFRILQQISSSSLNLQEKIDSMKNYSITLDNFFKMCLIIQRAVSKIPIIIQGQSGVGKTALIKFLVQDICKDKLEIYNIHAGIDESKLRRMYQSIVQISQGIKTSNNINNRRQRLWVFFDQFNTTSQLSYIKQMIIDRRFQGKPVPADVILIAACNPYRKRHEPKHRRAGIKKRQNINTRNKENLAFLVKPPLLSCIQFMWDFQQLQPHQNLQYTSKILQSLALTNHTKVVNTIVFLHQYLKINYQISSVSLRDVARFKQLYEWFMKNMPNSSISKRLNPNYLIKNQQRAISLSIAFCYFLRISDRIMRSQLFKQVTSKLGYANQIQKVLQNEQIDYVEQLSIPQQKVAINFSLKENIFTTLVCLMNKIPILIVGNPGNSKSLSIKMIMQNLCGSSRSQFCKKFPQLYLIIYQGSVACKSQGVKSVIDRAKSSASHYQDRKKVDPKMLPVNFGVLFDEIGLAQFSKHNPLKVIHSELQTSNKQICFIGISNWQLDAAKMSRFLSVSRSNPDQQELCQTAISILKSYNDIQLEEHKDDFALMAKHYCQFVKKWDQQISNNIQGFFGLRDFYCFIKNVAENLAKKDQKTFDQIKVKAIETNFDGQPQSIKTFLQISGLKQHIKTKYIINPKELIEYNLSLQSSRYLLLIVRGDALIPIVTNKIQKNGQPMTIQLLYGSTFEADQNSQQYNSEKISSIISYMEKGIILAFKNPNNSIQTSLYDVLNKSFTQHGTKKYCRIAVGANSNSRCIVHQNFGSIVFINQKMLKYTDLAFLNRFQKHYLTLGSVIRKQDEQVLDQIKQWIQNLLKFKQKTSFKKQQHYFLNSSQQSIVTLIMRYGKKQKDQILHKIKKALLKNATLHFLIALYDRNVKNSYIPHDLKQQVVTILQQINEENIELFQLRTFSQIQIQSKMKNLDINRSYIVSENVKDKIIFTFDSNVLNSDSEQYVYKNQGTYIIRISQIKSQKQLKRSFQSAFNQQAKDNIHIILDYSVQFHHFNLIAFHLIGMKAELNSKKKVYIIIKMSQISLDNADCEHINISYLLNFQQRFIQSLTSKATLIQNISNKSLKLIYKQNEPQGKFENLYLQSQARFRILQNQIRPPKGILLDKFKYFQYEVMTKIQKNKLFKQQAMKFIQQHLSDQPIDLSILLHNQEQRRICHSPKQMFDKYLQGEVINLICSFFDRIYRNNLLFNFDQQKVIQLFKQNQCDTLTMQNNYSKHSITQILKNLIIANISNQNYKKYIKRNNANIIIMQNVNLLPMSFKDHQYILGDNENSLTKLASKIIFMKKADSKTNQLIQQCFAIMKQKFVYFRQYKNKQITINFQKVLENDSNLQLYYFYDLIQAIYTNNFDFQDDKKHSQNVFIFLKIFIRIFSHFDVKIKIFLLCLNKQVWFQIFNLWYLWSINLSKLPQQSQEKIYKYYKSFITKCQDNHQSLPQIFIQFCQQTIIINQNLLQMNKETVKRYDDYFLFFRGTYTYFQKLLLICQDFNIQSSNRLRMIKRFFDLVQQIFPKRPLKLSLQKFIRNEIDFEPNVELFLSNILDTLKDKNDDTLKDKNDKALLVNSILVHLDLEIFNNWTNRLIYNGGKNSEMESCIDRFVYYSNKYTSFANNSKFFLQTIFNQFINFNSINEQLQYLEGNDFIFKNMVESKIDYQQNFSVSLGNFFMGYINIALQMEQKESSHQMNEQIYSILQKHENVFKELTQRNLTKNKILDIYAIQFSKIYCAQYLLKLKNDYNATIHITQRIDLILQTKSQNNVYIHLYLLKELFNQEKQMIIVRSKYFNKCNWMKMEHLSKLIRGEEFQFIVPPEFNQELKILRFIKQFRDSQYSNLNAFKQIIKQSQKSPKSKYEFLNFMMIDVYTRICNQDRINEMRTSLTNSNIYSNGNKAIESLLVNQYLAHKVSAYICFKNVSQQQSKQKQKKASQNFVNEQLIYLNYINMMVALSKSINPMTEIFFDKNGNLPANYENHLNARFLLNGKQNKSVTALKNFMTSNSQLDGYYICSNQCDFYYMIGDCRRPWVVTKCSWCKKDIGGTGHNLKREHQGARRIQKQDLQAQIDIVCEKKYNNILKQKYTGYSYSGNLNDIKQELQNNPRATPLTKYIQQQILSAMWSFLQSNQMLTPLIQKVFNINKEQFVIENHKSFDYYLLKVRQICNLNEQQNIIWHLGFTKRLFEFLMNYKNTLAPVYQNKISLQHGSSRDMFQQRLGVFITGIFNQRYDIINANKNVKTNNLRPEIAILKQSGSFEQYIAQKPKIRLIKHLDYAKKVDFAYLSKSYQQRIRNDYPILSYFIRNQQQVQNLKQYRIIYSFCTKVIKLFNHKLSRTDAKQKSLLQLYSQIYGHIPNYDQSYRIFKEELNQYSITWNKFKEMKFQLRYECQNLNAANEAMNGFDISSKSRLEAQKAQNFLPDAKSNEFSNGKIILAFLRASANRYNIICDQIQQLRKHSFKYRQIQLINTRQINPTQLNELLKTITLSQSNIEEFIKYNTNWTVQYGCPLPYISIDKIESLIVEFLVGSHIVNQIIQQYDSIHYIGEELGFIAAMRYIGIINEWDFIPNKQDIQNYFIQRKKKSPDNFLRQLTSIKGQLQLITRYVILKNPGELDFTLTIKAYLSKNRNQELELMTKITQSFQNLQLNYILAFYEFIQLKIIELSPPILDGSYKTGKLDPIQIKNWKQFCQQLPLQNPQGSTPKQRIITYNDVKVALHRFISRKLSLSEIDANKTLKDFIVQEDLWPFNVNIKKIKNFEIAFNISLAKIESLMIMNPLKVKLSSDDQEVDKRDKRKPEEIRRGPQNLIRKQIHM